MQERRQKEFAVCLMLCGICGLINGLNSIFSLGIPKWVLVILSLPSLYAVIRLMVLGYRHLTGKE
ncbi:MAG: hypothetical protein IKK08_08980 [Clostridia bacterium]|nr:hypothetical protein [Clostridia bacterium]